MIDDLFLKLCLISPKIKEIMWRQWYQYLARYYLKKDWNFMNYGYAPLENQPDILHLDEPNAEDRFCIQLYHHVAGAVDLRNLKVLEVGSGRGGGADYIKRYFKPAKIVGVDFSKNAVGFCKHKYVENGLSFEIGNAEALPFEDNSFNVVINVESSHCYGSMDTFLGQVKRVLHDGGHFLLADFRNKEDIEILRESLLKSGLTLLKETDITPNIVEALRLDNERKTALIRKEIHKPLVRSFLEFAGTEGSKTYEKFKSGDFLYFSFVLQK